MVYSEPNIKKFVNFSDKLFSKTKGKFTGIIYFVHFKGLNNTHLPKAILQIYYTLKSDHRDGKIIYLNRKNKGSECLILYGKDKYKTISLDLGSYIGFKIENGF